MHSISVIFHNAISTDDNNFAIRKFDPKSISKKVKREDGIMKGSWGYRRYDDRELETIDIQKVRLILLFV